MDLPNWEYNYHMLQFTHLTQTNALAWRPKSFTGEDEVNSGHLTLLKPGWSFRVFCKTSPPQKIYISTNSPCVPHWWWRTVRTLFTMNTTSTVYLIHTYTVCAVTEWCESGNSSNTCTESAQSKWMNEWMSGWIDGWINKQTKVQYLWLLIL